MNKFIREQRSAARTGPLPLHDIRVIDLATVVAAPFAATLMSDFGAEVIKAESPNAPDALRRWGVLEEGIQPFWSVFARNKLPITINLKSPEGKEIFFRLVEKSDVLIENMRPGTMERLGFDMDKLLALNPGLIIGRISGYGQTGPYSSKPGFGTLAEGFSGFTYLNAQPGGVPINAPLALADFIVGMHLAFAIMMALRGQERGVKGGDVIDMSLYEPLFGLFGADFLSYALTGEVPEPQGSELSYVAPRNNYLTKDGRWVALSGATQKPFERLMEIAGHPEMNDDPRYKTNEERIKEENRKVINRVISEWVGKNNLEELLDICDRSGITVGPVANMKDIFKDVHYKERESYVDIEDPITKIPLKIPNAPFRFLKSPGKIRFPGLPHGSANEVILRDLLDYSSEEVEKLKKAAAI
ncbi:MAG: CoA transferase [Deltaproteobacteria bacterium]|nr:CoA transferase [Deltaproteobacteria bacterium]MBW2051063.1 CoA transferase [Deltaproteobacteria bacterium]MBW2141009.1 CoA transferase [Deltaproteobacteria bacterium]MBW2322890.1 CoA transferase [Deltaproteobacteria bacterium]